MALAPTRQPYRFTVEEYLAFERASEERHEYLDGVIYAMAGSASPRRWRVKVKTMAPSARICRQPWPNSVAHTVAPSVRIRRCAVARIVPTRAKGSMPTRIWSSCVVPASTTARPGMSWSIRRSLWKCCPPLPRPSTGATSFTAIVAGSRRSRTTCWWRRTDRSLTITSAPPAPAPQEQTRWELETLEGLDANLHLPSINCTVPLAEVYERIVFPQTEGDPTL